MSYMSDYVLTGNEKLNIVNVSNPEHPIVLVEAAKFVKIDNGSNNVAITGDVCGSDHFLHGHEKLNIVDVSDPEKPKVLGRAELGRAGKGNKVVIAGNYAYVSDLTDGGKIYTVDVSNPTVVVTWTGVTTPQTAIYASGSGTTHLRFDWAIPDEGGSASITAQFIVLAGGSTIKDGNGGNTNLYIPAAAVLYTGSKVVSP